MENLPMNSAFAYQFAKNWIAGKNATEAISYSKTANAKGLYVVLNYLGEELESRKEVNETLLEYTRLLDLLETSGIRGCISTKLTQLGLRTDTDFCYDNFLSLVRRANKLNRFVWVDMENSNFTAEIIRLYSAILQEFKNVGICIQAQLKRSSSDIEKLLHLGGKIRLVKGVYREPSTLAYKSRKEIDENYMKLLRQLFANSRNLFSISTHDDKLIEEAILQSKIHPRDFEFGFLKGIRGSLKSQLVNKGYRVTEYVPYGENWLPYSIRRMKEKPSNIMLLSRSLLTK